MNTGRFTLSRAIDGTDATIVSLDVLAQLNVRGIVPNGYTPEDLAARKASMLAVAKEFLEGADITIMDNITESG